MIEIQGGRLSARVKPRGAELASLTDAEGREFLWQAGEAWPRHAPILFPIVGRLRDDRLRMNGQEYRMSQHGFARDSDFEVAEQRASSCRLVLTDSEATRAAFPFPFRFEVDYALREATLSIGFTVTNTGEGALPFSLGAHPAFRWPLPGARSKPGHRIEFEQTESEARRLRGGLLDPTPVPFPIHGHNLGLREELFREDALILPGCASRRLRYTAPGAPVIELAWQGFTDLGLWMKPGAEFLCIEPWAGHSDPVDFEGSFFDKPGVMALAPGEASTFSLRISLEEPA